MNVAHLSGPLAPDWFAEAIARAPERGSIPVAGAAIETLCWGERGRPGLLFLHGNGAHADWWRFIAPFFADDWRVAAISWSGMGRSGWRASYSMALHREEVAAALERLGLFEGPAAPQIVAHSFGSVVALQVAAGPIGDRLGGVIVADNGAREPREQMFLDRRPWASPGFATQAEGVARFRLRPAQRCDNDYILSFIAEHSLCQRRASDGATRWHWCFDPDADSSRGSLYTEGSAGLIRDARCPLAFIWGDRSVLMPPEVIAATRAAAAPGTRFVVMPDAGHHLMLDQPLGFVAALRALLQR